jgi:hypothetical protein
MSDEQLPSTADHVGQAAGGITGVVAGAAIGASAGPIGILLGGIAGAIGGWWSGRALAEAAEDITAAEEDYYRADFERRAAESRADRRARERRDSYDDARAAYLLGDVAAANPEYDDRRFEDVEGELSRAWNENAAQHGEWQAMRGYASIGFERGRERRSRTRRSS